MFLSWLFFPLFFSFFYIYFSINTIILVQISNICVQPQLTRQEEMRIHSWNFFLLSTIEIDRWPNKKKLNPMKKRKEAFIFRVHFNARNMKFCQAFASFKINWLNVVIKSTCIHRCCIVVCYLFHFNASFISFFSS